MSISKKDRIKSNYGGRKGKIQDTSLSVSLTVTFPPYYTPRFIMRNEEQTPSSRIFDLWTFKSLKSNKRYIVEMEQVDENFYAIKFYWKAVEKSKKRYSLLTNDYEPRRIIRSCIEVMLEYIRKNPRISFGFLASDDLEEDINGKKLEEGIGNRRFRFYRNLMLNLFGPESFYQVSDINNNLYLMLNRKEVDEGRLVLASIEKRINTIYSAEFRL